MVDVVLVILIFFMASAALVGPEWLLRVALAQTEQNEPTESQVDDPFALPPTRFVVKLSPAPVSGDSPLVHGLGLTGASMAEYEARLGELVDEIGADELVIVIEADDAVGYEQVVRARDLAAHAGIEQVGVR